MSDTDWKFDLGSRVKVKNCDNSPVMVISARIRNVKNVQIPKIKTVKFLWFSFDKIEYERSVKTILEYKCDYFDSMQHLKSIRCREWELELVDPIK